MSERERLIRSFFPLVKRIAHRISRMVPGADVDDLVGDGSVGLIRAVDSFDPKRGPTLHAYVSRVIAGWMLNGLRKLDPVSERARREIRHAERERYERAGETGTMPTQHEMETSRPKLRRAITHAYRYAPLSLDAPLPADENLSADTSADPALIAAARYNRGLVFDALRRLTEKQRKVVMLYYFRSQTLYEIGSALAITPQRASQLHVTALRNLRKALDASALD